MRDVRIAVGGGDLAAVVHLPAVVPAPVVVCCHGLVSTKGGGKYVTFAEELSRAGIAAIRFDFTACGESTAKPEGNLIATRLRDLAAVLGYVRGEAWSAGGIGLLGSSFGGYIALLAAASGNHSLRAVVSWAAPFDLAGARISREDWDFLMSTLPPGFELGEPGDLRDLPAVADVLVIHGERDEVVPWTDAGKVYRALGEPKMLMLFEEAEHRFLDPGCRARALDRSIEWFRERFARPTGVLEHDRE